MVTFQRSFSPYFSHGTRCAQYKLTFVNKYWSGYLCFAYPSQQRARNKLPFVKKHWSGCFVLPFTHGNGQKTNCHPSKKTLVGLFCFAFPSQQRGKNKMPSVNKTLVGLFCFSVSSRLTLALVQDVMTCWIAQGVTTMRKVREMAADVSDISSQRRRSSSN